MEPIHARRELLRELLRELPARRDEFVLAWPLAVVGPSSLDACAEAPGDIHVIAPQQSVRSRNSMSGAVTSGDPPSRRAPPEDRRFRTFYS